MQVFRCWDEGKKKPVCLKEQVCETIQEFNGMLKEGINQTSLLHPGICKLYECFLKQEGATLKYAIVMEWMERDLQQEIDERQQSRTTWSESDLLEIMYILVDALAYAQEQGICHRDIKPHNIFINHSGSVKIGDFGSSSRHQVEGDMQLRGTPLYLSPALRAKYINSMSTEERQSVSHNPYKSDVYSLGISFLEMAKLEQPTHLATLESLDEKIKEAIRSIPYSETVRKILGVMLPVEEEQRPDFIELREQFRQLTGFAPTEEALEQESRKGIFKKCVFCNKRLIQKMGYEIALIPLPCDPRNHVFCAQVCFGNYVRASTLDLRLDLDSVLCPKKKCKVPIPVEFTRANFPSLDSPAKGSPTISPIKSINRRSSELSPTLQVPVIELAATESIAVCGECGETVDVDAAAECMRSGRELSSKPVVLSCNSQHVFCGKKCFIELVRKQTNNFSKPLGTVHCVKCQRMLSEEEVTALAGGKAKLERARDQSRSDYVACNECKGNKAQVTFNCGHGFCKMCIRGRYEVYRIQGKRNWLCPICKEPMHKDTSVKSLCRLF